MPPDTEDEQAGESPFDSWLIDPKIGVPSESFAGSSEGESPASATVAQGSTQAAEDDGGGSGQESGDGNGGGDSPAPEKKEKTDDSKLIPAGHPFVSESGKNTADAGPTPGVDYDFCLDVVNQSNLPSGGFTVHFELTGQDESTQTFSKDSDEQDGLGAGASTGASPVCVHFGQFENKFDQYDLTACVIPKSAPDKKKCLTHSFPVMTKSSGGSGDSGE